jgi:hypothetical protein
MEALDTFSPHIESTQSLFVQAQVNIMNAPKRTAPISRPRGGLDHAYGGVLHLLTLFFGDF